METFFPACKKQDFSQFRIIEVIRRRALNHFLHANGQILLTTKSKMMHATTILIQINFSSLKLVLGK